MFFTNCSYLITHYYHSGFSVSCGDTLLIFDYWRGEDGELPENQQITAEKIQRYTHVVVFVSHEHIDHLDPVIYEWKDLSHVSYVVSSDMPVGTRGKRMAPGDTYSPADGVEVTAFDSTDLGVSYLVNFRGMRFFHAGDLNFWHWREESTMKEIEEADAEFRKAVAPLSRESVDIAFFPLDPRQGSLFEAGANYFILTVKPRVMIPMHYFHRTDVAVDYARTASCRSTEVIALPSFGDRLSVETDDMGYLNVRYLGQEDLSPETDKNAAAGDPEVYLNDDDPFSESDLPVSQLLQDNDNPQTFDL